MNDQSLQAASSSWCMTDWRKVAEEVWSAPSWTIATVEYRESRGERPFIVEIEPKRLQWRRRLMQPGISLQQAYWEITDPSNRPTPAVVVEAVILAVRERRLAALKEPATVERLRRCDAAARDEINQRIQMLGLK
jgi:hypothetical protein